eukprot:3189883-Rhodomonas_salina.7
MSGTDIAMVLSASAMSGTEIAYAATRSCTRSEGSSSVHAWVWCYARPVLTRVYGATTRPELTHWYGAMPRPVLTRGYDSMPRPVRKWVWCYAETSTNTWV